MHERATATRLQLASLAAARIPGVAPSPTTPQGENVNRHLIVTLSAALAAAACGTSVSDSGIALDPEAGAPATSRSSPPRARPTYREVTILSGTTLPLTLLTAVASDTSRVEDTDRAELTDAVSLAGREALPAGTKVTGIVTSADGAGRVKGRAFIALRFTSVSAGSERYDISTASFSRQASATKGEDATKIAVGAGAGAVIGGLLGGGDGAAKGAAIGGGAGTGVVLATKGREVRLGPGADVTTRLTAPLTVRVGRS